MIPIEIRNGVKLLRAQGQSLREISRLLKVSRNAVRRILRERDGEYEPSPPCDLARLEEAFKSARGNGVRVQELLAETGLNVPYSTLTRWIRQAQLREPPQRSGEYHQVNRVAQGAHFSYQTLTRFARQNRCGVAQSESNPTRSLADAQKWLSETIHGGISGRSLETLKSEVENSSDLPTLLYMARNGRLRERKKALTIVARKRGISNATISAILHSSIKTTRRYFRVYSEAGPSGLFGSRKQHLKTPANPEKTRHILELLHQKPTTFGINRTSWTQRTLVQAYKECHNAVISRCTVQRLIKNTGYSWRKARRVLTSPDPNYEEKVELLSRTLRSLGESELLFFLDEWGPVQVRKRGGKAYSTKYDVPRIPRPQTVKGTVTLVAALSATTNQMTWAFAKSKDTCAMMDLLEILYNQYQAHSKLYVTWDAVSWHTSATLTDWLDRFNEVTRRQVSGPVIELVPLPTSSQFLNVIEGVLSGMTRAVINNSDYGSSGDMKHAISRYFTDRNKHFTDNPRRAGKGIWEVGLVDGSDTFTDTYERR